MAHLLDGWIDGFLSLWIDGVLEERLSSRTLTLWNSTTRLFNMEFWNYHILELWTNGRGRTDESTFWNAGIYKAGRMAFWNGGRRVMFWNHRREERQGIVSTSLSNRGFQTFPLGGLRLYISFWNSGILSRRRKSDVRLEAGSAIRKSFWIDGLAQGLEFWNYWWGGNRVEGESMFWNDGMALEAMRREQFWNDGIVTGQ